MTNIATKAQALAVKIQQRFPADGVFQTAVPRLSVTRFSGPTPAIPVVYQPAVCLVVQGAKKVILGERIFEYNMARYLAVSVDVPVTGQITEASDEAPYLCLKLDLDLNLLSELMLKMNSPGPGRPAGSETAIAVSLVTSELLQAFERLLLLTESAESIPVLSPLTEQEILYWLLQGEQGWILHQLIRGDNRLAQVNKAIQHLKYHYREPFSKSTLLELTCMSATSFFQHFKDVTAMTPLQYQKQLRLQEARRLLLAHELDVSGAGYQVGYESPSQFAREYSRLFGLPPSKDLQLLKGDTEYHDLDFKRSSSSRISRAV